MSLSEETCQPDLGDFVIVLLTSTLASLRDQLAKDGFSGAADLVADLTDIAEDFLDRSTMGSGAGRCKDRER